MEAVVGLLLMLLGVSHGVETYCDGRQDGAQCYGALGGTVVLWLMDNASEIFRYQWSKTPTIKENTTTTTILLWNNYKMVSNTIENRSFFTPSHGTFRINNLSWTDEGEYKLEIFDSNGVSSKNRTLQLTIQEAAAKKLPIMAGVLSALVILLVVGGAVVCSQKQKQNNKPKEEDDQELTYADVRTVQRPGKQVQQKAETGVEYGQVKFSERPQ